MLPDAKPVDLPLATAVLLHLHLNRSGKVNAVQLADLIQHDDNIGRFISDLSGCRLEAAICRERGKLSHLTDGSFYDRVPATRTFGRLPERGDSPVVDRLLGFGAHALPSGRISVRPKSGPAPNPIGLRNTIPHSSR